LCGSGSAVAAVYKKERERDDAVQRLGERNQRLIKTTTRSTVSDGPQLRGIVSMRRSDLAGFVAVVVASCHSSTGLSPIHDLDAIHLTVRVEPTTVVAGTTRTSC